MSSYRFLKYPALVAAIVCCSSCSGVAQNNTQSKTATTASDLSKVWVADQGNGTYKNPILYADYSDPDAIRVGDDYYMTSSSFNAVPGLQILHSKDLVNWKIIGYALDKNVPAEHYAKPQHGNGVWAPSIRHHNGEYYIYWGDPDFGIYMVKAKDPAGPWEKPVLVMEGKGLIDSSPLWDDDGNAYLVHAYAGSRAGIKSVLAINKMNPEGTKVLDEGVIVFDGHENHPTVEGPKFYKKDGYYYIFAPAGGVATGWQLVLRSKNIYGPYEEKIVMDQGKTSINGPHQGAWVTTQTGEDWFLHFQDIEAYGRVVHLQPMKWKNGWPVIGEDKDGDGTGWPVMTHKKPNVGNTFAVATPAESDEFEENKLGLQWQWHANPKATWAFPMASKGKLRLYTDQVPEDHKNLWDVPNLLLQKFPAETFTATTKLNFTPNEKLQNERTGLVVMGEDYAYISLVSKKDGLYVAYTSVDDSHKGTPEKEQLLGKLNGNEVYFRVAVDKGAKCQFSYSEDGKNFKPAGSTFTAVPGRWIGAKVGIFATRQDKINDAGYADYDWFRITPNASTTIQSKK
ncbi:glycoside hydrolase family 43 protein [Pontibacter akesuensis]|uniref:Beta-xylosidase n=1 Tax=Pontibacter akesuensis TaxID=388950 RepID=A0A1I7K5F7_9BACT|nr:glycoside hydrolase 43 family protein [Pontibacter akesuensis]GHA74937.1 glycoside hydrolase [Pontibacter akesuensis]SFU92664.1 Beta-xylosidase [Pontibacter akesuensis]